MEGIFWIFWWSILKTVIPVSIMPSVIRFNSCIPDNFFAIQFSTFTHYVRINGSYWNVTKNIAITTKLCNYLKHDNNNFYRVRALSF